MGKLILPKGSRGYIANRRKIMLILTLLLLAGDLLMFFISRSYFGTNKNIFSVFAALICLPIGKCAVSTVMFFRAHGCSDKAADIISETMGNLPGMFDVYLTSYQKNYALSHLFIFGKSILALCEDGGTDVQACEKHIRSMLSSNELRQFNVKVFTDFDRYLERMESCSRLSDSSTETEEVIRTEALLKAISI